MWQEAAWLNARYHNGALLSAMRRDGGEAFLAHMDIEGNPAGVVDAMLKEMAYMRDELPSQKLRHLGKRDEKDFLLNIHRPPEHLLRKPILETQEMGISVPSGAA